jgi:hypothetical protein
MAVGEILHVSPWCEDRKPGDLPLKIVRLEHILVDGMRTVKHHTMMHCEREQR